LLASIPIRCGSSSVAGKPLLSAQIGGRLRFRHLQFLDILGGTRNLRLTAEQMHITQPGATKILLDIEEIFESRLFEHLPREMRPNELGLFALRYAKATLAEHKTFVDEFNALKQGGHGQLSVGAISGAAAHLLTASIREIQRRRPLLVLQAFEHSSDQLIAWLAERKIDLMIGRYTEAAQRAQFHFERLSSESLWVVAHPEHPLRDIPSPGVAELAQWPWVLYPRSTAVRRVADDLLGTTGSGLASGVVETTSFMFAFELMQTTDMLSLQPAALVEKYVHKGLLTRIPVDIADRTPDYGVITRLGEVPAPAAQDFIGVMRSLASEAAPNAAP
jgi:DNA-binding transcriptional LysR family regulator